MDDRIFLTGNGEDFAFGRLKRRLFSIVQWLRLDKDFCTVTLTQTICVLHTDTKNYRLSIYH